MLTINKTDYKVRADGAEQTEETTINFGKECFEILIKSLVTVGAAALGTKIANMVDKSGS